MNRIYTAYAGDTDRRNLNTLLEDNIPIARYQTAITQLGASLGRQIIPHLKADAPVLLVCTAEDADYLAKGTAETLHTAGIRSRLAVFWNNHHSIRGQSVAPITQKYLQDGWQSCRQVIMLKSIVSGSCVIRTNLIALLDDIKPDTVAIAAPVMHSAAEEKLKADFPDDITGKFSFFTFAIDQERNTDGIVIPGIGGEIYPKLGFTDQPARLPQGYLPQTVQDLMFAA